jgi:hypothetical protein
MKRLVTTALLLLCLPSVGMAEKTTIDAKEIAAASGWKTTQMDLDMTFAVVDSVVTIEGRMVLAPEAPAKTLALLLNSRRTEMVLDNLRAVRVDGMKAKDVTVERDLHDDAVDTMSFELLRFPKAVEAGQSVELEFSYHSSGQSKQVLIRPDIVYASWVEAWYPIPVDDTDPKDPHTGGKSRAPGKTTFHLPAGWWALSNGERVSRKATSDGVVDVWQDTFGTARSFVAGPYLDPEEVTIGDRTVAVYLLTEKPLNARAQAERLNQAIDVLASCFGPYPYATFAIAEAPQNITYFGAASEQGFIVAVPFFFASPDGNLPLFAHEAGHTWWGNLVSSTGPGAILCSESIAQYGAVLALDAVEGHEAALDFLEFSRKSYVPNQCARGYFAYLRGGKDRPLSELDGEGQFDHALSDAKGHWVYHMLREAVGDSIFFSTLRDIVVRYTNEPLSLQKLREEFIKAAPQANLEQFFAQWLDRTGAPVIDLQWTLEKQMKDNPYVDHKIESITFGAEAPPFDVTVVLDQVQSGDPYVLDLELGIEFVGGKTEFKTLHMDGRHLEATMKVDALPREIRLDPNRKLLIWRPVYGPKPAPEVAATGASTP